MDYTFVSGNITLNSNTNVEDCVTIVVNGDECLEGNETFEVLLMEELVNVELSTSSAAVTIEDDDSEFVYFK